MVIVHAFLNITWRPGFTYSWYSGWSWPS